MLKDNDETDIDCGGSHCDLQCILDKICAFHSDCATGWCDTGTMTCKQMPISVSCANNILDAGETDIDCGFPCAVEDKLCAASDGTTAAKKCVENRDCQSMMCDTSLSQPVCVSCSNNVKDGEEADIDCGASHPSRCKTCADKKTCTAASQCSSGRCEDGKCSSCYDGIASGDESSIDCGGGSCTKCDDLKTCTSNKDCKSGFCMQQSGRKICVTKAPAQLVVTPSGGVSFVATDDDDSTCRHATTGVSIRPTVGNTTGWQFCQLKATVTVDGGSTIYLFNLKQSEFGTMMAATPSKVQYQGTPPEVENFLRNTLLFCPSCLPRTYKMRISITTLGSDTLSPCPTDQTYEHYINADTAASQTIEMEVRDAECVSNNTCASSSSLLTNVQIHVNAGACFSETFLTDGKGRVSMTIPLSRPKSPIPSTLNITLKLPGFATVVVQPSRFDGAVDLGSFYLVKRGAALLHPSPMLKGFVLDASTNSGIAKITEEELLIFCYRGFGISEDLSKNTLVETSKVGIDGSFSFEKLQPGLYTIVATFNGYVKNTRTVLWHDEKVQLLLSPIVPDGGMRVVLSWESGSNAPMDLDLHVKFKVTGTASELSAAGTTPSTERRALEDGDVGGYGSGYGGADGDEEDGGYGPGGDANPATANAEQNNGDGDDGVFVESLISRECDVFEYSRACGGISMETTSRNNTVLSGGESVLLRDVRQTVYTFYVRNYLQDFATEFSGAMLEFYDATGKIDVVKLPSLVTGSQYEIGTIPSPSNGSDVYSFRSESTYARMACVDAVGGENGTQYEEMSTRQACIADPTSSYVVPDLTTPLQCRDACSSNEICQGYSMSNADAARCTHLSVIPTSASLDTNKAGVCWAKAAGVVSIFSTPRFSQHAVSSLLRGQCPPSNERALCSRTKKVTVSSGVGGNGTVEIFDGSGPHYQYKPSQACQWDISLPAAGLLPSSTARLILKWERFEMERWSVGCSYDYVQVFDASCDKINTDGSSSNLLYKSCGCGSADLQTNRPTGATCNQDVESRAPSVITRGSKMCVQYITDKDVNLNGIHGIVSILDNVKEKKEKCRAHVGCQECIADSNCGYCHSTFTCDAGNALGDFNTGTSTSTGSSCPAEMWSVNDCNCRDGAIVSWNVRDRNNLLTDGSGKDFNYRNSFHCKWNLWADNMESPGDAIVLSFKEFDVEPGFGCLFDSVKIKWTDHSGNAKSKSLCKSGGGVMDKIEITGLHPQTDGVEITFTTDASVTHGGFSIKPELVKQRRVLLDTTWSGCVCENTAWTHQGVSGTGCSDIPDGRAVCRVTPGSCTHQHRQWPPRGQLISWSARQGHCQFPFLYKGQWHNDCINIDNGNVPWCTNLKYFPTNPWYSSFIKKISCDKGRTDFYQEKIHLDYCSSWRTDDTGKYYNDYSGSLANNPLLQAQYVVDEAIDWVLAWRI